MEKFKNWFAVQNVAVIEKMQAISSFACKNTKYSVINFGNMRVNKVLFVFFFFDP